MYTVVQYDLDSIEISILLNLKEEVFVLFNPRIIGGLLSFLLVYPYIAESRLNRDLQTVKTNTILSIGSAQQEQYSKQMNN